jgi:hypothetical protein
VRLAEKELKMRNAKATAAIPCLEERKKSVSKWINERRLVTAVTERKLVMRISLLLT